MYNVPHLSHKLLPLTNHKRMLNRMRRPSLILLIRHHKLPFSTAYLLLETGKGHKCCCIWRDNDSNDQASLFDAPTTGDLAVGTDMSGCSAHHRFTWPWLDPHPLPSRLLWRNPADEFMHECTNGPKCVLIEAGHHARVDAAVLEHTVPTFPDGGSALKDGIQPAG